MSYTIDYTWTDKYPVNTGLLRSHSKGSMGTLKWWNANWKCKCDLWSPGWREEGRQAWITSEFLDVYSYFCNTTSLWSIWSNSTELKWDCQGPGAAVWMLLTHQQCHSFPAVSCFAKFPCVFLWGDVSLHWSKFQWLLTTYLSEIARQN